MDELQKLLSKLSSETLTEESLSLISEAITTKAKEIANSELTLKVEAALAKQDEEFSNKFKLALEKLDADHTKKMTFLVEKLEENHCKKLNIIVERYKTKYLEENKQFKNTLINKIDKFFDIVVEEHIPEDFLKEAVENTRSKVLIEQIAKMIGVDKVQQNKLVKEGIMDAKEKIDSLSNKVNTLIKENKELKEQSKTVKRDILLEQKCQGLPSAKKEYIKRVLGNKTSEFILENFDYTLKVFDDEDELISEQIAEDAKQKSKSRISDVEHIAPSVIEESLEDNDSEVSDFYMDVLKQW